MTTVPRATEHHVPEERLVDLALGEARSPGEQGHLDDCADCRSLLDSLHRTLAVTRDASDVVMTAPPPGVWTRIRAEVTDAGDRGSEASAETTALRPDGGGPYRRRGPGRRRAVTWLAAACAAGVLVGVGGSVVADRLRQPETRTIATAQLDTPGAGERRGSATVEQHDEEMTLRVRARGVEASDGYAEVWLINRDGERMVSVGVLEDSRETATFPISRALLDEGYVVVDISREEFDDEPAHSGDSVVRGSLS